MDTNDFLVRREALRLSQAELARLVGCSPMVISFIERGQITHGGRVVHRLARVLAEQENEDAAAR